MSGNDPERLVAAPRAAWRARWSADPMVAADTLALLVPLEGRPAAAAREVLAAVGAASLDELPGARELAAEHGDTFRMPTLGRIPARELLFVRYGEDPDVRHALVEAAQVAGRLAGGGGALAVVLPEEPQDALDAVLDGVQCARRRDEGPRDDPRELLVVGAGEEPADFAARAERAAVVGGVLERVRRLVDAPPNVLGPLRFAEVAAAVARDAGAEARVWSVDELRDGGFAGLLAVGAASVEPPALVELSYRGGAAGQPPIVLVGKGITFDSGGYDVKPLEEMVTMKRDMAGAAAVLGAVDTAARLRLPVNVVGMLAIAENVLGRGALRPGEVIRHRNGVTSEVTNPDAEGRLVMADVLAYAAERRPAAIVEASTLVGPPLGAELWGLLASDDALADALLTAGAAATDRGWRLPLWQRYRRHIATPTADQRNSTRSLTYPIAVISSALFLDRFVPAEIPWAHLDISVTALRDGGTESAAWPAGPTGSPLRALVRWLADEATA